MSVFGFMHMRAVSAVPEEDGGSPRVGFTGDCELPSVDAGIERELRENSTRSQLRSGRSGPGCYIL